MLFLGGLICVAVAWAQDYQKTAYGIKTTVNDVDVEVQFFTPSVVRIVKSPHGEDYEKKSLSVVASPKEVGFKVNYKEREHRGWHGRLCRCLLTHRPVFFPIKQPREINCSSRKP